MNIWVVSRNAVFGDALVAVCGARGVAISETYGSLADFTRADAGDVLLFHVFDDIQDLPGKIAGLIRLYPGLRILMLVPVHENESLRRKLAHLVTGLIPENASVDILISALILARQGYRMMDDPISVAGRPIQAGGAQTPVDPPMPLLRPEQAMPAPGHQLSKREETILVGLCSGNSNKTIANALGISDATVKVHLRTTFRKIGVTNRTQAAMWALINLARPASGAT